MATRNDAEDATDQHLLHERPSRGVLVLIRIRRGQQTDSRRAWGSDGLYEMPYPTSHLEVSPLLLAPVPGTIILAPGT